MRADRDTGAQTRDRGQVAAATAGKAAVMLLLLLMMMLGCWEGPGVRLASTTLARRCMYYYINDLNHERQNILAYLSSLHCVQRNRLQT